jgi:hypothetical protein
MSPFSPEGRGEHDPGPARARPLTFLTTDEQ